MGSSTSKRKNKSKELIKDQSVIQHPLINFNKPKQTDIGIFRTIPPDLFYEIASYCEDSDLLSLMQTCKSCYFFLLEPKFWNTISKARQKYIFFEDEFSESKYRNAKIWYFLNKTPVKVGPRQTGVRDRRQIMIVGHKNVGKTQLAKCLQGEQFTETKDVHQHSYRSPYFDGYWTFNNNTFRVFIWDVFVNNLDVSLFWEVHIILVVYSVSDRESFNELESIQENITSQEAFPQIVMLVSTKNDLPESEHVVKSEEGQKWAEQHHMMFVEASAKSGQGIHHIRKHALKSATERNSD